MQSENRAVRIFWPIAILALVGLLVWLGFEGSAPGAGVVVIAAARAESAPAQQIPPVPAPRAASHLVPDLHPGQVEICGLGWVDPATAEAQKDAVAAQIFASAQSGSRALITRLQQDSSPFAQAVGLMVQAFVEIEARRMKERPTGGIEPCEGPECPEAIARDKVMSELTNELARRATQSNEPRLYALAFSMCRSPSPLPTCSSLSSRQWARIDPENGTPWLFAAEADATGKPSATIDEVLFQIGKARRVDSQYFAVAGEIARHVGKDDSSILAASLAATEAIGVSAAQTIVPFKYLIQACRDAALNDANRRQLCEGAVETLVNRSDSLLLALIGTGMGRRLGWDATRTDESRGLLTANMDSLSAGQGSQGESMSCADVGKLLSRFGRQDEIGEVAHAREWIKQSGHTQAEYTQKARETRLRAEAEELARRQAQAASAAKPSPRTPISSKPN